MPGSVLLIDNDPVVQRQTEAACARIDARLTIVHRLDEAHRAIEVQAPDVVLLDVGSTGLGGFAFFEQLRQQAPRLCAILIAERASCEQAIEAMKRGAIDYLIKPLDEASLISHLTNALRISRDMTVPPVYESEPVDAPVERIIGQSPAMQEVFKLIGLIAPRDVNVLIHGESGTGKELVARALYHHSARKGRPFLAVNCAAIPETLLESELFGHEKGAFTGADVRRIGKFEQCNGGTLLLDEIGDMPPATQAKLLRVLQDGSFQRLGSAETVHCDVRILAATNQPLERLIAERRFREDLYYRLKVAAIALPPLRDREVDVVLLAHYFVRRLNPQMGTSIQQFAPEVLPALLSYRWPGNVRELENVIKASLVVARGTVFRPEFLPEAIRNADRLSPGKSTGKAAGTVAGDPGEVPLRTFCRNLLAAADAHGAIHRRALQAAEREAICACLEHCQGQIAPAARLLGVSRTTLRRRIRELDITVNIVAG